MIEYFNQPVGSLWEGVGLCLALLGVIWILRTAIGLILSVLGIELPSKITNQQNYAELQTPSKHSLLYPWIVLTSAAMEEVVFRWWPIFLAAGTGWLWVAIITSSIVFGLAHGVHIGCLLFQGVGGFAFCLCFLKLAGGESGIEKNPELMWIALVGTTFVHFIYNFVVDEIARHKTKKLAHT